jgi:predicted RNA-binding protein
MCQISVFVEGEGGQEKVMDNVTSLEVTPEGLVLSAFFEEPKTMPDVVIARIDFLGGRVILARDPSLSQE